MNIIKPSYEILEYPKDCLRRIERAARTCYKSEDKTCDGSAKRIVENLIRRRHLAMVEFGGDMVVKFVSNRGFSHELVRHRMASFAQESTRYCNYSKKKFTKNVTYIDTSDVMDSCACAEGFGLTIADLFELAEAAYLFLVNNGCPAEIAREVLPIGTKAEIVIKANIREWRHVFELRTSRKSHPRMRELMIPLLKESASLMPIVFDDIKQKVEERNL